MYRAPRHAPPHSVHPGTLAPPPRSPPSPVLHLQVLKPLIEGDNQHAADGAQSAEALQIREVRVDADLRGRGRPGGSTCGGGRDKGVRRSVCLPLPPIAPVPGVGGRQAGTA
jgi:hypothetical protein